MQRGLAPVFVSHSSKSAESVAVRDAVVAALRGAIDDQEDRLFEPRIDHGAIEPGDSWWRNVVNTWMVQCHAAILLISDAALRSPYVGYEISILMERKQAYPDFCVLPLVLPGADTGAQAATLVQALRAVQAAPRDLPSYAPAHVQDATDRIVEDLKGMSVTLPPLDEATAQMADILQKVAPVALYDAAEKLPGDSEPWFLIHDPHVRMASKLMSAGSRATEAIYRLMPSCGADDSARLLQLVASGWANPFFANRIVDAVTKQPLPFVGLRLSRASLLKLYLARAFGSSGRWVLVSVEPEPWQTEDDAMASIRAGLREALSIEDDEELTEYLRRLRGHPRVFVAMRPTELSLGLMARLRHELPSVTYVFTYDRDIDESTLASAGVTLVPSTSDEDEQSFSMTFITGQHLVKDRPV